MARMRRDANVEKFKRPDPETDPRGWLDWWRPLVGWPEIEASFWLLEEARKGWYNRSCNELVYCAELPNRDEAQQSYIEAYERGKI